MRFCPLAHVEIPCSEAAPLCPSCALKVQAVYSPPPIEIAAPAQHTAAHMHRLWR